MLARGAVAAARVVGLGATDAVGELGAMAIVLWRTTMALATTRLEGREFVRALAAYGPGSVLVVGAAAAFAGAIMVLQGTVYVERFGAQGLIGWYTGFVTLREVGPLLMGLVFSGHVGASHAAELAAMRINEQLDALRVMTLSPYDVLVGPRTLGMVVGLGLLAILGDVAALLAGAITARVVLGVDPYLFWGSLSERLTVWDALLGLEKAMAFGLVIAVVATHVGLRARPTARGVGEAVNRQVVLSAVGMFTVDAVLTWLAS